MQRHSGPKITIVTASFNSAKTIRETIVSVKSQDYPNFEHIIVDGGSTDGTLELLKEYPHLIWVSEKDEGHYHAMNKGIEMATGEAIIMLNADDYFCDGILGHVARALEAHPEWDAVFGDMIFVDDDGREIFRREEAGWDSQIIRFGAGIAHHQTLFVRKKTYERLGLLRHKDFKNMCDYEFLQRMASADCKVGHVPHMVVRFRYHQYGQSADKRILANMKREAAVIRQEYGLPARESWQGQLLWYYARAKRQLEKLAVRGKCDLIPGRWLLRKHLREKTEFSSNVGLDKL